jgi:hypothetical protein
MAQVVKCLPSKFEALSYNSSITKKKKKKMKKKRKTFPWLTSYMLEQKI